MKKLLLMGAVVLFGAGVTALPVHAQDEGAAPVEEVDSSVIDSVQYDEATQALTIKFNSGSVYEYQGVPAEVHQGLMNAESKGKYFQENIKGKYEFSKKP